MSSTFFKNLARGVRFDAQKIQSEVVHFKPKDQEDQDTNKNKAKNNPKNPLVGDLDFFGFDAITEPQQAEQKQKSKHKPSTNRLVDAAVAESVQVPTWAGNEPTSHSSHHEGSKRRRKRRLSESALEEEKMKQEERSSASMKLVPRDKKKKRKAKTNKSKKHHADNESDDEPVQENHQEDEDSDEQEDQQEMEDANVKLFAKGDDVSSLHVAQQHQQKAGSKQPKSKHGEEVAHFRRQMGIKVEGTGVPNPIATFDAMKLDTKQQQMCKILLKNIELSEYKEPTAVQMQAIPSMLLRRDVLATAPTGSGKTAAFVIPLLANLAEPKQEGIRSIILVPTRELAVQIESDIHRLSKGRKFHIVLLSKATAATIASQIKNKCTVNHDILIATPLRLVHLIEESKLDLSSVECICLDEADRLFDMGFVEQIDSILACCTNKSIQRAMFSATMLQGVEDMAQSVLRDPIRISIGIKNAGASTIDQRLVFVGKEEGKLIAMKQLIQEGLQIPALLFVQNKERANELYHELLYDGINVGAVHADRTKEQRDETMRQFRVGTVWVLICTDLMSRGIDFKAVNMVINYDFPQSAVSYIHRIGRTGRGSRKGLAVTFFTESDMQYLRSIANVMRLSGCEVPEWMLSLKTASVKNRKKLLKAPPKRHRISTVSGYDLEKANKIRQMKQRGKAKANGTKSSDPESKAVGSASTPAATSGSNGSSASTQKSTKKRKKNKATKTDK